MEQNFSINDVIYFEGGMISFSTKSEFEGKYCCYPTAFIKKEKGKLYSNDIDNKLDKIIMEIMKFTQNYNNHEIDNKYKNFLECISKNFC